VTQPQSTARAVTPADTAERQQRLAAMKRRANGLLVLALAVLVIARLLEPAHPWLGYVRATAEASLVGGLADWFAVTALFRHPLGIPIPHTAIVARQKDRIGRVLGNFVQNHFLSREIVTAELRGMRLSERVAHWIARPGNSARLARQLAAAVARTVEALPDDEVRAIIQRSAVARIRKTPVAPVLSDVLTLVTADDRHQELLNEAIGIIARTIEDNPDAIRDSIRSASPWWVPSALDQVVFKKVLRGVTKVVNDVRANPQHPLRRRFDQALSDFIDKLKHSPEMSAKAEALKEQMLGHPMVEDWAASLWDSARSAAKRYRTNPEGAPPDALERGISAVGESLLSHPALAQELDGFLIEAVATVVEQHRPEVAELITHTVSAWDAGVAVQRLELAVGSDLQYIRMNGTLVGGLVGLCIHAISQWLR
jgi:uncharacterized membrane-anchored protein YjiN (DUF445 family)